MHLPTFFKDNKKILYCRNNDPFLFRKKKRKKNHLPRPLIPHVMLGGMVVVRKTFWTYLIYDSFSLEKNISYPIAFFFCFAEISFSFLNSPFAAKLCRLEKGQTGKRVRTKEFQFPRVRFFLPSCKGVLGRIKFCTD
jgi:hypothetical protein